MIQEQIQDKQNKKKDYLLAVNLEKFCEHIFTIAFSLSTLLPLKISSSKGKASHLGFWIFLLYKIKAGQKKISSLPWTAADDMPILRWVNLCSYRYAWGESTLRYIYSDHVDVCHPYESKKKKKWSEYKGDSTTLQLLKILCTLWGSSSWM